MLPRRRPRGSLHDGISLNFATGRYFTKAQGGPANIQPLTSLFTFTGGNQSMYMGPAGLLVASATNTPRIEYDANGNCLGLLMEAARTNLALQSQDLSTSHSLAALLAFGSGSTVNATTAPDGTSTADKIVEDTATTLHRIRQTTDVTISSGATVTFSYHVKAAERTKCRLRITESTFASAYEVSFDLSAGTIGTATTTGVASGGASRMTALPNGWYRISITAAINGGFLTCRTTLELENAAGSNSYTGDGASGLYAWGEQIEVGAFPSSYIPTTTVAVARTADRCIRTLSTEFSATTGTFVVRGDMTNSVGATPAIFAAHNNAGTGAEEMILYANAGARRWLATDGGVAQGNVLGGAITDGVAGKMACAYAVNDLDLAVNGVISGLADTSATLPTITHLDLMRQDASSISVGHILTFDYWPTRQPNTYLVSASS